MERLFLLLVERKGRDLNPRYQFPNITVFETAAFSHSATFPLIPLKIRTSLFLKSASKEVFSAKFSAKQKYKFSD